MAGGVAGTQGEVVSVKRTNIEWTDFSANPLKYRDNNTGQVVWACAKVSAGCAHCYAESLAERFDRGGPFTKQRLQTVTPFVDTDELRKILTAKTIGGKAVAGSRCFLGDMTDIFGDWVPDSMLDQLFAAMALRDDVTFQVLTKRPERMAEYLKGSRTGMRIGASLMDLARGHLAAEIAVIGIAHKLSTGIGLPNVHLGTSVENRDAIHRIETLCSIPAAVRFLSCEPLLGPVDIEWWLNEAKFNADDPAVPKLHWVICGGESGPGARPCNVDWIRDIVRQCRDAAVPCFVKQFGSNVVDHCDEFTPQATGWPESNGPVADWDTGDIRLRDKKGGNPSEWPADLRVREFPAMRNT